MFQLVVGLISTILFGVTSEVSALAIAQMGSCTTGAVIQTVAIPTSSCLSASGTNNALSFNSGDSYTVTCSSGVATVNSFSDGFCRVALASTTRHANPNPFTLGVCSMEWTFLSCDDSNSVSNTFPLMAYSFTDTACSGVGIGTSLTGKTLCENDYTTNKNSQLFSCLNSNGNSAQVSTFSVTNCNAATPMLSATFQAGTCIADPENPGMAIKIDCGGGVPISNLQQSLTSAANSIIQTNILLTVLFSALALAVTSLMN